MSSCEMRAPFLQVKNTIAKVSKENQEIDYFQLNRRKTLGQYLCDVNSIFIVQTLTNPASNVSFISYTYKKKNVLQ